tara:strand:- start:1238 stop:1438 length:201 start_codon:yes stop_codon:yes gene_type:complete
MNSLENEAKRYTSKKRSPKTTKPLTARRYLAGQALAGLLSTSAAMSHTPDQLKREAYNWADLMLED